LEFPGYRLLTHSFSCGHPVKKKPGTAKMRQTSNICIAAAPQGGYHLTAEQLIDLPRPEVFSFFADAMQLERITPPFLDFSVLTPQPINMCEGLLLDYKLHLHRVPIKWRTEINVWNPPFRFVDNQLRGPYKRWHHEHVFEEVDGGRKTLVKDKVHYIPRGGSIIHKFFVKPELLKIFRYRQDKIREIFAAQILENAKLG